jgi:hypothetical protein
VTDPVGLPVAGATGATVAVKVTGWPTGKGVADEVSATDTGFRMTWVRGAEAAAAKLLSPE